VTTVKDGFFPFDEIPDSGVLPDCTVLTEGQEIRNEVTSTGKKMYVMQASVAEGDHTGQFIFENFVIGTDDDPMATELDTWKKSVGARRFKGLLKAANIPSESNEAKLLASFQGTKFLTQVSQYTEKSGDYAGTVRNRFNFYKVGTRATGAVKQAPRPASVAPSLPPTAAPSPPSTPAPSNAPGMITCPGCKEQIAQADFAKHVNDCAKLT